MIDSNVSQNDSPHRTSSPVLRGSLFVLFLLVLTLISPPLLQAAGYIEITASGNRQLTLAVDAPRTADAAPSQAVAREIGDVISFDMNMSGIVKAEVRQQLPLPGTLAVSDLEFSAWKNSGVDLLVRTEYSVSGNDLTIEFRLYDTVSRSMKTARRFLGNKKDLRRFAHTFSDEIMLSLTGERGCFTTRIAYVSRVSGNKEIFIMDWDGYNQAQLTRNGSINLNPAFSPDGRELIFSSYKRGNPDLYKRSLTNPVEQPISTRKGLNITGAWSPDGSKIALAMSKDGDSEIYTISKDGKNPVRLTINPAIEVSPSWSPDGSRIAFVSDRFGKPQLFTMAADGGNPQRLTHAGSYNVTPAWSPKGDKIAYARSGGGFQIYSINPDGSGDTQLTTVGNNENPSWSPDGRFITFHSTRDGGDGIYVMRADGSGQIRVSTGKGSTSQPAWSPRY